MPLAAATRHTGHCLQTNSEDRRDAEARTASEWAPLMKHERERSPFGGLSIAPTRLPVVELLVVGLVLEAVGRGDELGVHPEVLLTSDTPCQEDTAIPSLIDRLASELGISDTEVEVRTSQYLRGYRPATATASSSPWRPPPLWPF